ncbi:MAG: type II toxin-antitoxin system PemK/MazF family toxin [Patescibacteria group bacterium]
MKKDFQGWCKKKEILHSTPDEKIVYFRDKEIWWCALGVNIGFEQDGKNHNYERPVLVLKKINRYLALVVPLSTKTKDHPYYLGYQYNSKSYSALVLQIRVVSSKRFLRRIGKIENQIFLVIADFTRNFIRGEK